MRGKIVFFAIFLLISIALSTSIDKVDPKSIKTVHIVWMNHLDIGFTIPGGIGYTINVVNKYFKEYFPLAVSIAETLRSKYPNADGPRLIYTTHPWLVANYLDCKNAGLPILKNINVTLYCPTDDEVTKFKAAVKRGDITWHAFPFNSEAETYDESLFGSALRVSERLSELLGVKKPNVMSQRDVPGITRSIIPHLYDRGIKALSIGVNDASSPAGIPNINIWREPTTKKEIYLMYHPGGYGGDNITDSVIVPGSDHALIMHVRSDNQGPGSVDEVELEFYIQHMQFPNAKVQASTFDDYVSTLDAVKANIPVLEKEIGDTWIYGVPSDPVKVTSMRAFSKVRAQCIAKKMCDPEDPRIVRFDRLLMKHGEHTWGIDVKTYLHDWANWTNAQFEKAKKGDNYQQMIKSWLDQRSYHQAALKVLGSHPLAAMIQKEIQEMKPKVPTTAGYTKVTGVQDCKNVRIGFGSDGSVNYLYEKSSKKILASASHTLGKFVYNTYDSKDFTDYLNAYGYIQGTWWFPYDFGKTNLSESGTKRATFVPQVKSVFRKGDNFLLALTLPEYAHIYVGAPSRIYVSLSVISTGGNTEFQYRVQWFDKTPTRLPEALWFSFNPVAEPNSNGWSIDKLGYKINPLDIVKNGSFHLHGTTNGVFLDRFNFRSIDAAVVSPGKATPFPIPLDRVDGLNEEGMSFCLYNNIWGTNYIMWYPYLEEDRASLFRFTATLKH
eukprot:TRINITY_DN3123_c0_g1_i1.p1 TRINITY_DN3123_c0_g1~~TRINITY_DN3123_c0_g1_i1.p1  ORF type:complete len:723 (-),score=236.00 TRINITY_DN3123_c0_g1_i1:54-2222(-)